MGFETAVAGDAPSVKGDFRSRPYGIWNLSAWNGQSEKFRYFRSRPYGIWNKVIGTGGWRNAPILDRVPMGFETFSSLLSQEEAGYFRSRPYGIWNYQNSWSISTPEAF